ncbi:sensor histidine kinase [Deinococcus navajonensis]|uniref:histidine kinase n=1 Tax=Deinococcus navajonensis TaxID=309884 RepID=A0ABV8XJH4_9DEIO
MTTDDHEADKTLRGKAEAQLQASPRPAPIQTPETLLHELQVHQIELEHQNEELRRAMLDLENERTRYQQLFDFAPIGYLTLDPSGIIEEINQTCCGMLGLQRQRLTGRRLALFVTPEYRGHLSAMLKRTFEALDRRSTELMLMRPDGSAFWAQLEGHAIDQDGRPGGRCRVAVMDISVQKQAQQDIMQLNQTLEQRVEQRSAKVRELSEELERFTYDVATDLQGPLGHILSFSDMLAKHATAQDPEVQRYADHIRRSGQRMEVLTTALLAFSRASRMRMRLSPIPMDQVLKDVRRKLAPDLTDCQAVVTSDPLPVVQADSGAMQLVLRQLLDNALKFTRGQPEPRIHVFTQDLPREVVIAVRDNGVGFNMRYRDRLFSVFQRLHSERDYEGAGVGLATVRRVMLRLGGRVWAEGRMNEGATFYLALPKHPGEID